MGEERAGTHKAPLFMHADGWRVAMQHVFMAGVSNACGQTSSHPFDLLKTRLQIQGVGGADDHTYRGVRGLGRIYQLEGLAGLYKGWRAAIYRELTYSGMRVGLYEPFKELLGAHDPSNTPFFIKLAAGCCSGASGAFICTPLDIMKVRFQAAGTPEAYKTLGSPLGALRRVFHEEGFRGLYRGVGPTTARGAMITAAQVPSYDHIKHSLLNLGWLHEGRPLHFIASVLAGLVAVAVTNPVDVVKTRVMNQSVAYHLAQGPNQYRGPVDCFLKIVRTEGPLALYKGAFTAWLRLCPHTIVTFLTFEQLRAVTGVRPV
eukprot:TRINITY_DN4041_c0_g1_i1.p1 TRINITY_DN4041_c0_g1~~TRINITY_DN4041_c0_g1_i1.p1  ORF type:complete len:317 (+),score=18.83 TRINITY_DN4041_c0_g1_i1:75-1025(+)